MKKKRSPHPFTKARFSSMSRRGGGPPGSKAARRLDYHRRIIAEVKARAPLSPRESFDVAEALMEAWLPKTELRSLRRQRALPAIESALENARKFEKAYNAEVGRLKPQHGAGRPRAIPAMEVVAGMFDFESAAALAQWIKRQRQAKKSLNSLTGYKNGGVFVRFKSAENRIYRRPPSY